ncbi:MAG: Na/Pi symporter, partial [Lachnospiraceae bacterium]|nr:Na/Pi symporter [Lachnospiraceae bacterium]
MSIEIIFGLMAGLSLFLYGMQMMSDGLQKVAGAKLRNVLAACTKNKLIGLIVGVVVTAIIQSSSTTTVLVVSFVNAGLMNLSEAVGIILGANIGTTVTGQLLALNLTAFAPVFAIVGVVMIMFFKKTSVRKTGEIILGFGMLLIGMEMMCQIMWGLW